MRIFYIIFKFYVFFEGEILKILKVVIKMEFILIVKCMYLFYFFILVLVLLGILLKVLYILKYKIK